MPSPFDGKWRLESAGNDIAPFFEATKCPDAYKTAMVQVLEALKQDPNFYVEELKVEGDKLMRKSYIAGKIDRDVKDAPFDKEVEGVIDDGRTGKIKLVREGNNKIVRIQNVDGINITAAFEVNGDTLTLILGLKGLPYIIESVFKSIYRLRLNHFLQVKASTHLLNRRADLIQQRRSTRRQPKLVIYKN